MLHTVFLQPRIKRLATYMHYSVIPAALLLAACATPPQQRPEQSTPAAAPFTGPAASTAERDALRALASLQGRLDRVAAPLLVNNATICKGHARNLLGFSAKNKYSYSTELADAAQEAFGFDDRLQVTNVLAGSGAARVGIRRGDILLAVDDKPIPQGENAERNAAALLVPLMRKRSEVKLTALRNNANVEFHIPLTLSCAFSTDLGNADHVNAYADGRRILVTRGMVNFTQSDEELAYVLAREMAHNVLNHPTRQHMNATMDGIIDNLIRVHPDLSSVTGMAGVKPYPQQFDADADRLSLYMAARAGYDIDHAPDFWRRLAAQYPASILNGYTAIHPATDYRLATLEKTVTEIKAKQAAKRPLLP